METTPHEQTYMVNGRLVKAQSYEKAVQISTAPKGGALRDSFKPGHIYKLIRDVVNPKPDRRQKYDWTAHAVWAAGTRFHVRREHIIDDIYANRITTGRWSSDGFFIVAGKSGSAPAELLAAMVEVKPTLAEELDARDLKGYGDRILEHLIATGVISLEQVIQAGQDVVAALEGE